MAIAVVAPVVLLLVMGGMLAWQIDRMSSSAELVDRTNVQLAKLFELRMRLTEQESSLRRYLLTGDRTALHDFERISPLSLVGDLRRLYLDLEQLNRLDEIEVQIQAWRTLAMQATAREHAEARDDHEALTARVRNIHRARELMNQSVAAARDLLAERSADAAATDRTAKILFVSLLGMSALTLAFVSRRQLATVSTAFELLVGRERASRDRVVEQEWVRRGEAEVAAAIVGERSVREVASAALDVLCAHTGAIVGALYQVRGGDLHRVAAHGLASDRPPTMSATDGQLGQALAEGKPRRVAAVDAQLEVVAGIGRTQTVELVIVPARVDQAPVAVIELGYPGPVDERTTTMLEGVATTVALAIRGSEQRARLQDLLEETQRQGEELQAQHEELRSTNEELETQSHALREAQTRQQAIQHELEAANASLEEQTAALELQREELLTAQKQLQERARDLQLASQYKSEFLARMSHELRTPLNSSLILARLLGDNPGGNLSEEQVKFANTIYSAGNDLLAMINDILDLAKIEAGRLELRVGPVVVDRVREALLREFEPVAASRGLSLAITVAPEVPAQLQTDEQRVMQVLRNLISNACKFTERGGVTVTVLASDDRVCFVVRDTGIGIPPAEHGKVFEAFHQIDGSVSRKHGGTGLGLAISRDLASLLGGELRLASEPGRGSTFTLEIPALAPLATSRGTRIAPPAVPPPSSPPSPPPPAASVAPAPERSEPATPRVEPAIDDRDHLEQGKKTLLVIEDDLAFAAILRGLGRELGYQTLIATTADEGVGMALRYVPDGILLDLNLPDHSGLSVLERLKRQPAIRHVPIHVVSVEDHVQRSLELGAVGYLLKPTSREELIAAIRRIEDRTAQRVRRVLVVEDDEAQAAALRQLLASDGVEIAATPSIAGALDQLSSVTFDCVVMDLHLADGTGFELLERMTGDERITFPPVIVHTGKSLTDEEEALLQRYSSSIVIKGARSPERLLDEVTLFLHQVEAELPPERQQILRDVRDREAIFEGKRVLVVEDDVRNVFALSSLLEPRGLELAIARNGREALEILRETPIDLVLMDIMMPEMNGLDATREIRRHERWRTLPIIALTAKAMADDRQACLDAGANDYLAKPIDVDMLLSLLRVWMPR